MSSFLAFAQIGDLHLTDPSAANAGDLRTAVDQLNAADGLDFVFLPGDNADHGRPEQYGLVRAGLRRLRRPAHVIAGDHDMEGGDLSAFYGTLGTPPLPYAETVGGVRCLFLDMCGPGGGGPDFRLGPDQVAWLARELGDAGPRDVAVFMHSYPADLKGDGEASRVSALIHRGPVRLVAMGHTHYNELANDGRTIYAATRSTGQIEEGGPGFSVAALDDGVLSWRFKDLAKPWPLVLVTSPADRRLAHDARHAVGDPVAVRALVLGAAPIVSCDCRVDDGPWRPMTGGHGPGRFGGTVPWPADAARLQVRAIDADGRQDVEAIEPARDLSDRPDPRGPGSDADAIGAWPEKGILGTQLGPNRNGRAW